MAGWVPLDADTWPAIAAALPKPWPAEAARFDLRWHADRARYTGQDMPGRRHFRDRWGWADWPTRKLCKDEAAWADPAHSPAPLPRFSQKSPAILPPHNGRTGNIGENPPAILPEVSRDSPAILHTRVGDTLHPTPSQEEQHTSPETVDGPSSAAAKWAGAVEMFREHLEALGAGHCIDRWRRTDGKGRHLNSLAQKRKPEDIALVLRWLREHPDNDFRREKGYAARPSTVRSKFGEYLDEARAWEASGFATAPSQGSDLLDEGRKAFDSVRRAISSLGPMATSQPFSEHDERDQAVRVVIRAIPLSQIANTRREFDVGQLRERFAGEYARVRREHG